MEIRVFWTSECIHTPYLVYNYSLQIIEGGVIEVF